MDHVTKKQSEASSMPGLSNPQAPGSFPASGTNGPRAPSGPALQAGPDWYRMAQEELARLAETVRHHTVIRLETLHRIADGIVKSLQSSDRLVVQALSGANGSPLITNLVNVSIMSVKLGMGLEYRREELERLALAGLLHDIGIFAVPESLILKPHRLNHSERAIIEQHPELGFQVLSTLGSSYSWLAQVVRQAHERWKGQGYPNKLKGAQIHDYAQIIGIVDVFDALISPRPYRRRILPHEAVRELLATEQSSFSRELIKALVEQLSAYPLGTTVRLNTGEVGVVTQLNSRYPLRPVVQVSQTANRVMPNGPRLADLSKTPLMYIVETLEPPTIENLPSALPPSSPATLPPKGLTSSEQFAALLESLDAVAGAVEQVVETPTGVTGEPAPPHRDKVQPKSSTIDRSGDPFQKEVLKLFALEAHEWLRQIRGALRELEGEPDQREKPKLFDMILRGVTNLGGSAATVELPAIQQLAFGLLPLLQALRSQGALASAEQFTALRNGLERITTAVCQVAEPPPAASREPPRATADSAKPATSAVPSAPAAPQPRRSPEPGTTPSPSPPSGAVLELLQELQQSRARSLEPTRNVVEAVIQKVQSDPAHRGSRIDGPTVQRILRELNGLDEQFLTEVQRQVPMITEAVSALKSANASALVSNESLEPILREVQRLHEAARAVNATAIMLLLHGLHTFLTVVAHRRVSLVLQRLEAVESRLGAVIPMAQQWVEVGRIERAAIDKVLSQS
ncbi:MAG TPA: HD domain-containing phosphohydrolase [Nitrospiraceae bacterium]|nr:HD domain-containing phosphohydrolase [Nitrospiraceae bacterium]